MHEVHLDFAVALHHQLPTEGNLSWSPYSVASALGLAAAGARGDTQQELARLIAPEVDQATLVRWLSESASLPEAELAVANALWLAAQLGCRDEYRELVRQLAGARSTRPISPTIRRVAGFGSMRTWPAPPAG